MERQHRPVRSGALTLLFTTVLLCLAVLGVLSLATARADQIGRASCRERV